MINADILIVGSGLVGASAAIGLAKAGFSVGVLEALSEEAALAPQMGRAYALSATSVRLLSSLGLGEMVSKQGCAIGEVLIRDVQPGEPGQRRTLGFDHLELGAEPLGAICEDPDLRAAFDAAIRDSLVERYFDARVTGMERRASHWQLSLADGREARATLIVAADGRDSQMRRFSGISAERHRYDQATLSAVVAHEKPHWGVAEQVFLPGGPLALLPLKGNRSAVVWSARRAQAEALAALAPWAFELALRDHIGDRLGAIAYDEGGKLSPLLLSIADRFVGPGLLLVGDAARAVHPIAGQGLNAGMHDVGVMIDVLQAARRRGENAASPVALAEYQAARYAPSLSLAISTDALFRIFSAQNGAFRSLRASGMGAVASFAPLRSALMRAAAGKSGILPRMMR